MQACVRSAKSPNGSNQAAPLGSLPFCGQLAAAGRSLIFIVLTADSPHCARFWAPTKPSRAEQAPSLLRLSAPSDRLIRSSPELACGHFALVRELPFGAGRLGCQSTVWPLGRFGGGGGGGGQAANLLRERASPPEAPN